MPENDDATLALLEALLADAAARGRRDEPLIVKLSAAVEARKPKAQAKPDQPKAVEPKGH